MRSSNDLLVAGDELRIVAVDLENEAISNAWLALRPHAVAVVIGVTSSDRKSVGEPAVQWAARGYADRHSLVALPIDGGATDRRH